MLTAETTLVAQFTALEKKLAGSLALLNERAELCQQMGEDARKGGDGTSLFEAAAREALTRAEVIKKLLEDEWVQPLSDGPARGTAGYHSAEGPDRYLRPAAMARSIISRCWCIRSKLFCIVSSTASASLVSWPCSAMRSIRPRCSATISSA